MEKRRLVWVLGAGFSRPLGGPLLRDFFRPEMWAKLTGYYPLEEYPLLYAGDCRVAHALYNYGITFRNGKIRYHQAVNPKVTESLPGEHIWEDAEEFIAFLETAAIMPGSGEAKRTVPLIKQISSGQNASDVGLPSVAAAAKRLVAAECSTFLIDADLGSEAWLPYVDWSKRISRRSGDEPIYESTIITFNYDLVLERLAESVQTLAVADPGAWGTQRHNVAPVFKLHGSVNWSRTDNPDKQGTTFTIEAERDYALRCDAKNLAIAVPGPAKAELTGRLDDFWDRASTALQKADAIVFVGYRFPATDAIARKRLLAAIRDNQQPYLAVHAVLGPNTQEPDTVRLQELLHMTLWHRMKWRSQDGDPRSPPSRCAYNLLIRPVWAQDFLSAFNQTELFDPWLKMV